MNNFFNVGCPKCGHVPQSAQHLCDQPKAPEPSEFEIEIAGVTCAIQKGEMTCYKGNKILYKALSSHEEKVRAKAYTQGRIDEAKTCTGCQGRCEEQIEKVRASWLRSEIEKLEGMKDDGINPGSGKPDYLPYNKGITIGWNDALTSIITRYKEELLELDKGI